MDLFKEPLFYLYHAAAALALYGGWVTSKRHSTYQQLKSENAKLREALKACWEAEHYEYCGQQFSETGEIVQPCKSVEEHIERALKALENQKGV